MKYKSIWQKDAKNKQKVTKLPTDIVDILIVGGGLTGLTLAYFLKDIGKKVIVVDKDKFINNVSSRSTAKISFLQQDIYQKLEKTFDYETSKKYYESQIYAIKIIKEIIIKNKIDCDLVESDSYLFVSEKENIDKLDKEKKLLNSFQQECHEVNKLPIDFPVSKGFYVEGNYTFNPVKYLNGLINIIKNKVDFCNDFLVENITLDNDLYLVKSKNNCIRARQVVIACHYPFFLKPVFMPFKNYMKREYVCAAKCNKNETFNAINLDQDLHSIRFYKDYLIYVSNSHRLINKLDISKNYDKASNDFSKYFKLDAEYVWLNQDIMTNDHLPIIGKIKDNLFIATGYNAWGMTNSCLGAKIISDLITNQPNNYQDLVKPNRMSITGFVNSVIDSISYVKPYVETVFINENIYIEEENGVKYNVYIDKDGNKHKVKRKCPHLKCNLLFNQKELTWDCPCHGSRFDLDGNLIEGPSCKNINKDSPH